MPAPTGRGIALLEVCRLPQPLLHVGPSWPTGSGATELPGKQAVSQAHLEQGTVRQRVTVLLRGPWAALTLRGVVCYRGGPGKWRLVPYEESGRIAGSGVAEDSDAHLAWRKSLWIVVACEVSPSPGLIHFNKRFLIPAIRQDLCWEPRYGNAQTNTDKYPARARLGPGT